MDRRKFFPVAAAGAATLIQAPRIARAETLIKAPARLIVGFPPGGSVDIVARAYAQQLRGVWSDAVVVENRPGAAGRLSVEYMKAVPADGSVILFTPDSMITTYPHVYRKLRYDAQRDVTPIAPGCAFGFSFAVSGRSGINTLAHFAAWAKANPNEASFASPAVGSSPHFVGWLAGNTLGIPLNMVPFQGVVPAMQSIMAGDAACTVVAIGDALQHHRSGRLRVLAVAAPQRSPAMPEVPTFLELGHQELSFRGYHGFFGPAGMPASVVGKLNELIGEASASVALRTQLQQLELDPYRLSVGDFNAVLRRDNDRWAKVVKASGFAIEE
jgi:tripartite-type tricarboxylate transporter receptor subunit TctC